MGTEQAIAAQPITAFNQLRGRQMAIAMAGVLLGLLLSRSDSTIVGTAMPRIIADLGGLEHYAWVATAYLLTSTAAVPIFGKLSDIYGRKWFYVGGLMLFMFASALCGLSQSMTAVDRLPRAAGRGRWHPHRQRLRHHRRYLSARRARQMAGGERLASSASPASIGPALGGWLTDGPGWRWVFYVNLPVGVMAVAVLMLGLPAIRPHEPATDRLAGRGDDRRGDRSVAAGLLLGRH